MGKAAKADRIMDAVRRIEKRANVAAYVVLKGAEHVGTIRILYPSDGAGKLSAVAADWTQEMPENVDFSKWTRWQYGWANGYGYDKATAALGGMTIAGVTLVDQGWGWDTQLRNAGLTLIRAV